MGVSPSYRFCLKGDALSFWKIIDLLHIHMDDWQVVQLAMDQNVDPEYALALAGMMSLLKGAGESSSSPSGAGEESGV